MATVYKVEIEIVSDWTNFTPEDVNRIIKERVENTHELLKKDLEIKKIKTERIA
jgi:hypothetical protein